MKKISLLIVVLLLPFQIPYKITVPGKVLPTKEWLVVKGTDGRLMTSLINHKAGVHENYAVRLFERGDAVQFSFNPNIVAGSSVSTNDTIGVIYSNESQKQLINLKNLQLQSYMLIKHTIMPGIWCRLQKQPAVLINCFTLKNFQLRGLMLL